MAWFYLQLDECGTILDDQEGRECDDLGAAREQALIEARELMSAEVLTGTLCLSCSIIIEDERHREVDRVPFRDALSLTGI